MKFPVIVFAALVSLSAFCESAVPTVSNVALEQNSLRRVTVTYDLAGADGVVTAEFFTNGAPVSASVQAGFSGDVNRLVTVGTGRKIIWKPSKSWPAGGIINGQITCRVTAWPLDAPAPYLVVDLDGGKNKSYFSCEEALPGGITSRVYRTTKMLFRRIPAAYRSVRCGAPAWAEGYTSAMGFHYVMHTRDYYLGVFPVTQGQFAAIMGPDCDNPSSTTASEDAECLPVDNIGAPTIGLPYSSITDVSDLTVGKDSMLYFARQLTGLTKLHLPTRAQWEFACRAGSLDAVYGGYSLDDVAWHADNSGGTLHPVGLKKPNAFGLYDMLGNVAERVRDSAASPAYSGLQTDLYYGTDAWGSHQIMCGGSFASDPAYCSAGIWVKGSGSGYNDKGVWEARYYYYRAPGMGARLCLPID